MIKATAVMAAIMVVLSLVLMSMDSDHWLLAWAFCAFGTAWLMCFFHANWEEVMKWVSRSSRKGE